MQQQLIINEVEFGNITMVDGTEGQPPHYGFRLREEPTLEILMRYNQQDKLMRYNFDHITRYRLPRAATRQMMEGWIDTIYALYQETPFFEHQWLYYTEKAASLGVQPYHLLMFLSYIKDLQPLLTRDNMQVVLNDLQSINVENFLTGGIPPAHLGLAIKATNPLGALLPDSNLASQAMALYRLYHFYRDLYPLFAFNDTCFLMAVVEQECGGHKIRARLASYERRVGREHPLCHPDVSCRHPQCKEPWEFILSQKTKRICRKLHLLDRHTRAQNGEPVSPVRPSVLSRRRVHLEGTGVRFEDMQETDWCDSSMTEVSEPEDSYDYNEDFFPHEAEDSFGDIPTAQQSPDADGQ